MGDVLNIGGGDRITVNDVLEKLREITGENFKVDYRERQKGDARHTAA